MTGSDWMAYITGLMLFLLIAGPEAWVVIVVMWIIASAGLSQEESEG